MRRRQKNGAYVHQSLWERQKPNLLIGGCQLAHTGGLITENNICKLGNNSMCSTRPMIYLPQVPQHFPSLFCFTLSSHGLPVPPTPIITALNRVFFDKSLTLSGAVVTLMTARAISHLISQTFLGSIFQYV